MRQNKRLGAAMAGSKVGKAPTVEHEREKNDFYPTPADATRALLLSRWKPDLAWGVWEPACGTNAMVDVLRQFGYGTLGTDITMGDNGNFLTDFNSSPYQQIMTNPPFNLAAQFIEKAESLQVNYLALLLKMTFWSAATRLPLFERYTPAAVLPLTWRLDFLGGGAPTMDCAWYVWDRSRAGEPTVFELLRKPAAARQPLLDLMEAL